METVIFIRVQVLIFVLLEVVLLDHTLLPVVDDEVDRVEGSFSLCPPVVEAMILVPPGAAPLISERPHALLLDGGKKRNFCS